jgi:hypothetical protein
LSLAGHPDHNDDYIQEIAVYWDGEINFLIAVAKKV